MYILYAHSWNFTHISLCNFNALKCFSLHVATLPKINRTGKDKQMMNNLDIEFWTYMTIFFPFPFSLLLFGLEPQRSEERKKNLNYKIVDTLVFLCSFFVPLAYRRGSGPTSFIKCSWSRPKAVLVEVPKRQKDRLRVEPLLKKGTRAPCFPKDVTDHGVSSLQGGKGSPVPRNKDTLLN